MREHRGKCEEKNFLKDLGEACYFFNTSYKIKSMNKKNPLKMLVSDLKNSGNLSNNIKKIKSKLSLVSKKEVSHRHLQLGTLPSSVAVT